MKKDLLNSPTDGHRMWNSAANAAAPQQNNRMPGAMPWQNNKQLNGNCACNANIPANPGRSMNNTPPVTRNIMPPPNYAAMMPPNKQLPMPKQPS